MRARVERLDLTPRALVYQKRYLTTLLADDMHFSIAYVVRFQNAALSVPLSLSLSISLLESMEIISKT